MNHDLVSCDVCGDKNNQEDITHLRIYVIGSEGVKVCLICRQTLTEVLRGMMHARATGSRIGYMASKQVASAKLNQTNTK